MAIPPGANQAFTNVSYASSHIYTTTLPDGRDIAYYSGYVVFKWPPHKRDKIGIKKQLIRFFPGSTNRRSVIVKWDKIDWATPLVVPSAFMNDSTATSLLFAVDEVWFHHGEKGHPLVIYAKVAVRDTDEYILRLGYYITAFGKLKKE